MLFVFGCLESLVAPPKIAPQNRCRRVPVQFSTFSGSVLTSQHCGRFGALNFVIRFGCPICGRNGVPISTLKRDQNRSSKSGIRFGSVFNAWFGCLILSRFAVPRFSGSGPPFCPESSIVFSGSGAPQTSEVVRNFGRKGRSETQVLSVFHMFLYVFRFLPKSRSEEVAHKNFRKAWPGRRQGDAALDRKSSTFAPKPVGSRVWCSGFVFGQC